jgi:DNA-binding transcriptional LysR family regulator
MAVTDRLPSNAVPNDLLRDLEIRHLVALRAVADERSFGRAAERLGFTQSAVSQQIAALERVVGQPVFDRPGGPRPVEVTPAGRVLLEHAEAIFARLRQAGHELALLQAGDGGRLVVGTFQSVSVNVLPPIIGALREERPHLEIRLFEADTLEVLLERVLEGDLDLAFVVGAQFDDERLATTHLCDDPFVVISARGSCAAGEREPGALLRGMPMIGQNDSSCQDLIDRSLRAIGVEPRYVFRSNDNGAVQAMVRVGMGRAVLPALAVDASDPGIVVHQPDPPLPPRAISLVRKVGRTLPPAAERFTELAVEFCAVPAPRGGPGRAGSDAISRPGRVGRSRHQAGRRATTGRPGAPPR